MICRSTDTDQPKSLPGSGGESTPLWLATVSADLIAVLLEAEQRFSKVNPSSLLSHCLEAEALITMHHKWLLLPAKAEGEGLGFAVARKHSHVYFSSTRSFLITQNAIGYSYHNEHVLFWKYIKADLSHHVLFSNSH